MEAFYSIPEKLINDILISYLENKEEIPLPIKEEIPLPIKEEIPLPIIDFLIERLNKGMFDNFSGDVIQKIAMKALDSNKRRSDDSKIYLIKIPEKYRSLEISLAFVNQGFGSLEDITEGSRTEDVYKACLKRVPSTKNLQLVPKDILGKLYEDKDFLLAIVNKRATFLKEIPGEFHSEDLYLEALKNFTPGNGITIIFSSMRPELITPKVLDAALKKYDLFTINTGKRINEDEWVEKWSELAKYYTDNPTIEIPDRAWRYLPKQFIENRIEKDNPRGSPLLRKVLNICLRINDVFEDTSFDNVAKFAEFAECKHQWLITLALKIAPWVVAENIKKPWILPTYFNLITDENAENTYGLSKDEIIEAITFLEQTDLNRLMETLNPTQLLKYISKYGLPKNHLEKEVSVDIINLVAKGAQSISGKKILEELCKEKPAAMLPLLTPVWPMLDTETLFGVMVPILDKDSKMFDLIPKNVKEYETLKKTYKP